MVMLGKIHVRHPGMTPLAPSSEEVATRCGTRKCPCPIARKINQLCAVEREYAGVLKPEPMLLIAGFKTTEAGVVKTEGVPIFEKRLSSGNNAVVIGSSAADGYPIACCKAVGRTGGKPACGLAETIVDIGGKKSGPAFCPTRPEAHGIRLRRVGLVEGV